MLLPKPCCHGDKSHLSYGLAGDYSMQFFCSLKLLYRFENVITLLSATKNLSFILMRMCPSLYTLFMTVSGKTDIWLGL